MNLQLSHLKGAIRKVFEQLHTVLNGLTPEQYSQQGSLLLNASIGQHVRHIIELFMELNTGYRAGVVNYENRKRDRRTETDLAFAASLLINIEAALEKPDKTLVLEGGFDGNQETVIQLNTSYYRELAYNIEHSIHHLAMIRVAINQLATIPVDENFGIAAATIKHRKACVQ
jgi:uncharacterized damage-inducible protein DinB